jgi:N utilization substance protein B
MPARRRSRQKALQILFQWDARKQPVEDCIFDHYESLYSGEVEDDPEPPRPDPDRFMEVLARGTAAQVEELDQLIQMRAQNWRLERMPLVDRNILRMAIYEMKVERTPAPVVIDEAIELARRFSEEDAVPFINGVLDAVHRLLQTPAEPGGIGKPAGGAA